MGPRARGVERRRMTHFETLSALSWARLLVTGKYEVRFPVKMVLELKA